jgi:hypothetical protein
MSESIEAYPLNWPLGYPRTSSWNQSNGPFKKKSIAVLRDSLLRELSLMGASNVIISSNMELRLDGLPRSNFDKKSIWDRAIAVYFIWNKEQRVLCCDSYCSWESNLIAITKTVEALRGLERWGVSKTLKRTFQGFTELPPAPEAKKASTIKPWRSILGLPFKNNYTWIEIKDAWRKRSFATHPNRGGTAESFQEVQKAYAEAAAIAGIKDY